MMVLHHPPSNSSSSSSSTTEQEHTSSSSSTATTTTTTANTTTSAQNTARATALRIRRSRGMTGFSSSSSCSNNPEHTETSLAAAAATSTSSSSSGGQNTTGGSDRPGEMPSSTTTTTNNNKTKKTTTTKTLPCHSAELALLCAYNAIRMGARTQLNLCPTGRARRTLRMTLLQQRKQQQKQQHNNNRHAMDLHLTKLTNLQEYDRAEEEYLLFNSSSSHHHHRSHSNMSSSSGDDDDDHDDNMEEDDRSSGDEDDLRDLNDLLVLPDQDLKEEDVDFWLQSSSSNNSNRRNASLLLSSSSSTAATREPLFPTAAAIAAGMDGTVTSPTAGGTSGAGGMSSKLPFYRRKIKYFDMITAADASTARTYLEQQMKRSKRHVTSVILKQQLHRAQQQSEKGQDTTEDGDSDGDKGSGSSSRSSAGDSGSGEATVTATSCDIITRLETPMTPAIAAALLLESLAVNKVESVEGMSKCYDGIVAAGTALLDYYSSSSSSSSSGMTTPDLHSSKNKSNSKTPSRSEILSALAPLLITSLEQPSGEVIVTLAKLRRMCGTFRYQRRFVQRVAPLLVRPPRGAVWCLQHQNDMEAILAATELILDAAGSIFSKGWYERGQLLLADSQRAKTLDSAAKQLRSFSHEPTADDNSFHLGLSSAHGTKFFSKKRKDSAVSSSSSSSGSSVHSSTNEPLAEWEVVAVVRQIKISISGAMATDWSRVLNQTEVPRPYRRKRAILQSSSSVEVASPKSSLSSSPRSPGRPLAYGKTTSSHSPPSTASILVNDSSTSSLENAFGPAFAAQPDRAASPPPPPVVPTSPPTPHRTTLDRMAAVEGNDALSPNAFTSQTPPKSPKSPRRENMFRVSENIPSMAPLSPKRGKTAARETLGVSPSSTPLSPSTSSVGTSGSNEMVTYRPSSAVGVSSSPSSSTNYRMLTSTAAERKRTVAACRALRAQIQRFEDAFIQLHGRPPKGAAERAPLATTYAQYREWKRAIRADAACRIQALLRGAHTRSTLMRTGNPTLSRVIMKRPGRPGYVGSSSIFNQISIPVEIGESDRSSPLSAPSPVAALTESSGTKSPSGPALAPHWASTIRRRSNSGDRAAGDNFSSSSPARRSFPTAGSPTSTGSPEVLNVSLEELQARKRDLKKQLKQYDINFARRHGRMPVKAEKEPIRHLYESYNSLKSQIGLIEQEGRSAPTSSPLPALPLPRTDSPSGGSDSGQSAGPDSPGRAGLPTVRGRRWTPRESSSQTVSTSGSSTSNTSQDLQTLRAEKTQLHQMLRSYERDFYEEHRRQVSSFSDIRPVASQYRRYKEIKRAIASLQQQSGER